MAYRPDVRLSTKDVRAAWLDIFTPLHLSAARLGVHENTLRHRARAISDLPPRVGKKADRYPGAGGFWRAGCAISDISAHFGCTQSAMLRHLNRTGARKAGEIMRKTGIITVAEIIEAQLAERMARAAAIEQAHMINAGMVDRVELRLVGARHARRVG